MRLSSVLLSLLWVHVVLLSHTNVAASSSSSVSTTSAQPKDLALHTDGQQLQAPPSLSSSTSSSPSPSPSPSPQSVLEYLEEVRSISIGMKNSLQCRADVAFESVDSLVASFNDGGIDMGGVQQTSRLAYGKHRTLMSYVCRQYEQKPFWNFMVAQVELLQSRARQLHQNSGDNDAGGDDDGVLKRTAIQLFKQVFRHLCHLRIKSIVNNEQRKQASNFPEIIAANPLDTAYMKACGASSDASDELHFPLIKAELVQIIQENSFAETVEMIRKHSEDVLKRARKRDVSFAVFMNDEFITLLDILSALHSVIHFGDGNNAGSASCEEFDAVDFDEIQRSCYDPTQVTHFLRLTRHHYGQNISQTKQNVLSKRALDRLGKSAKASAKQVEYVAKLHTGGTIGDLIHRVDMDRLGHVLDEKKYISDAILRMTEQSLWELSKENASVLNFWPQDRVMDTSQPAHDVAFQIFEAMEDKTKLEGMLQCLQQHLINFQEMVSERILQPLIPVPKRRSMDLDELLRQLGVSDDLSDGDGDSKSGRVNQRKGKGEGKKGRKGKGKRKTKGKGKGRERNEDDRKTKPKSRPTREIDVNGDDTAGLDTSDVSSTSVHADEAAPLTKLGEMETDSVVDDDVEPHESKISPARSKAVVVEIPASVPSPVLDTKPSYMPSSLGRDAQKASSPPSPTIRGRNVDSRAPRMRRGDAKGDDEAKDLAGDLCSNLATFQASQRFLIVPIAVESHLVDTAPRLIKRDTMSTLCRLMGRVNGGTSLRWKDFTDVVKGMGGSCSQRGGSRYRCEVPFGSRLMYIDRPHGHGRKNGQELGFIVYLIRKAFQNVWNIEPNEFHVIS